MIFRIDDYNKHNHKIVDTIIFEIIKESPNTKIIVWVIVSESDKSLLKNLLNKYSKNVFLAFHWFKHTNKEFISSEKEQDFSFNKAEDFFESLNYNERFFIAPFNIFNQITIKLLKKYDYKNISINYKDYQNNKSLFDDLFHIHETNYFFNKKLDNLERTIDDKKLIEKEIKNLLQKNINLWVEIHPQYISNKQDFNKFSYLLSLIQEKNIFTNKDFNFFLSYQYLKENINEKSFNLYNCDNKELENKNIEYYISKLEYIFKEEIKNNLENKNIQEIAVMLSWWIDSFILLYYIRKIFPSLTIYTFTFFPTKANKDHLLGLEKLSKELLTIHYNIVRNVSFKDIIKNLSYLYKNTKYLIWDEWFIYNSILISEIKKHYKWKYIISWDWIDVIFWWLSMYRLSYLEWLKNNWKQIDNKYFKDEYEKKYFEEKINENDEIFFYKYWEYFWGSFLWENHKENEDFFYNNYKKLPKNLSIIKKQILFNYLFLVWNRKKFIYESWKIYNYISLAPFNEKSFFIKVKNLNIPDKYLLDKNSTKIIIRKLAEKIKNDNSINFSFLPTMKIDFFNEYKKNAKKILAISNYLYNNYYITKEHYILVPYFIKNSMWYENKIRIYLLLNLYFFIKSDI